MLKTNQDDENDGGDEKDGGGDDDEDQDVENDGDDGGDGGADDDDDTRPQAQDVIPHNKATHMQGNKDTRHCDAGSKEAAISLHA